MFGNREYHVRTLMPNFTVVAFKMLAYSTIAEIGNFWYEFPQRGISH